MRRVSRSAEGLVGRGVLTAPPGVCISADGPLRTAGTIFGFTFFRGMGRSVGKSVAGGQRNLPHPASTARQRPRVSLFDHVFQSGSRFPRVLACFECPEY